MIVLAFKAPDKRPAEDARTAQRNIRRANLSPELTEVCCIVARAYFTKLRRLEICVDLLEADDKRSPTAPIRPIRKLHGPRA